MNKLHKKSAIYSQLIESVQCNYGFIEHKHCDSLMFTSLLGCLPDMVIDIDAAFDKNTGMWHRRPLECPCYPKHSKSTISRDALLSLAWFIYYNNRLDLSEQVLSYAFSHWLKMGKGTGLEGWSRIIMTPSLLATYAWVSYRLGGPSRAWLRWIPVSFGPKLMKGFQAHLQVLHILLRRNLTGELSATDKHILKEQAKMNSKNALFQYANDNIEEAKLLLENEQWWPADRLPTRGDRKAAWLFERDFGSDWEATSDNPNKIHTGADFLFCNWLINGAKHG